MSKKVLCIKGKQCELLKEAARHQRSSILEMTVVAGDVAARTAQHLLWPEGMVLEHDAVRLRSCKAGWDTRNGLGSAFAGSIILL